VFISQIKAMMTSEGMMMRAAVTPTLVAESPCRRRARLRRTERAEERYLDGNRRPLRETQDSAAPDEHPAERDDEGRNVRVSHETSLHRPDKQPHQNRHCE
jgi:hypothetical protein